MTDPEINFSWLFDFKSQNIKSLLPFKSNDADNTNFEENLKNSKKKLEDKKETQRDILSGYLPYFNPLIQIKDFSSMNTENNLDVDSFKTINKQDSSRSIQIDSIKHSSSAQADTHFQSNPKSDSASGSKSQISPVVQKVIQELFKNNKAAVTPLNLLSSQEFIKNMYEKTTLLDIKTISLKIIDEAKVLKEGEKTEIIIDLKPEWLGSIILKISSDKGILNVNIFANESAKALIDTSISELEKALKAANLNIGSLQVSIGGNNQGKKYDKEKSNTEGLVSIDSNLFKKERAKTSLLNNSMLERFFNSISDNLIYSKI